MLRCHFALLCAVALCAAAPSAGAADNNGIEIRIAAETFQTEVNAKGETEIKRVPATKVVPGNEVTYTLDYVNHGGESAQKVVITNPIPEHMLVLAESTLSPYAKTLFSVDGGRTYRLPEDLTVTGADGKTRPATPADYTHIQWTLRDPLQPAEEGSLSYRAVLE